MAELDNSHCSMVCNNIVIELEQQIYMTTGFKTFTQTNQIAHRSFEGVEANQNTNGMSWYLELALDQIKNSDLNPHNKILTPEDAFLATQI